MIWPFSWLPSTILLLLDTLRPATWHRLERRGEVPEQQWPPISDTYNSGVPFPKNRMTREGEWPVYEDRKE